MYIHTYAHIPAKMPETILAATGGHLPMRGSSALRTCGLRHTKQFEGLRLKH